MASRTSPMDIRIRVSAALVILGLLTEGITIFWNSPGSFLAFAFLGVGLVAVGVALFLLSLVTVKTEADR